MRADNQAYSANTFTAQETAVRPSTRPTGMPAFIGLSIPAVGRISRSLISHLQERYPRVSRCWRIEYRPETKRFTVEPDEAALVGCYILKTGGADLDAAAERWRTYMLRDRDQDADLSRRLRRPAAGPGLDRNRFGYEAEPGEAPPAPSKRARSASTAADVSAIPCS